MTTSTDVKTDAKEETGFSITEMIKNAKDTATKTYNDYNDKYVKKNIETGKEFAEKQYKKVSDIAEKNYKKVSDIAEKNYKKVSEIVEKRVKTTRESVDEYTGSWKKYITELPMVQTVEQNISDGLNKVPALMNLPGKNDIEKLIEGLETLNGKVDALAKKAS